MCVPFKYRFGCKSTIACGWFYYVSRFLVSTPDASMTVVNIDSSIFFRYGQLSGMVEPIFGILGAVAVTVASIILPYALSFAAGAMIYIVADDILPEAHTRYNDCQSGASFIYSYCLLFAFLLNSGNGLLATWGTIVGFILMMSLDVGLG